MFPNVRLLIAAVVASVVALSCGFAVFAVFRVNHEPLSRLAAGAAPLQLAAGNPMPPAAIPAPADSFGNRFPSNNGDAAGASAQVAPPQPERDDSVEPPSAVATTAAITTTAPETEPAEPAQPAPVAQAPQPSRSRKYPSPTQSRTKWPPPRQVNRSQVNRCRDDTPAAPIEAPPGHDGHCCDRAATRAARARRANRAHGTSQSGIKPSDRAHTATTATAEPPPPEAPTRRPPTGTGLPPRRNVHAKPARSPQPSASQPESAARSCRHPAALSPGRHGPATPVRPFSRSASRRASAAHSCHRRAIERRPIFGVGLMAARAETT